MGELCTCGLIAHEAPSFFVHDVIRVALLPAGIVAVGYLFNAVLA